MVHTFSRVPNGPRNVLFTARYFQIGVRRLAGMPQP